MKQPQVVVTAKISVESLVVTTTRGSRHPPAIRGKLCDDPASSCLRCAQLCDSSLSWIGPPIGGRSFANESVHLRVAQHPHCTPHHPTPRTNALSVTCYRYFIGNVSGSIGRDAKDLWPWLVA